MCSFVVPDAKKFGIQKKDKLTSILVSVRMSLDAWGASLLPDIPGAPFQMIRLPIASSDEA